MSMYSTSASLWPSVPGGARIVARRCCIETLHSRQAASNARWWWCETCHPRAGSSGNMRTAARQPVRAVCPREPSALHPPTASAWGASLRLQAQQRRLGPLQPHCCSAVAQPAQMRPQAAVVGNDSATFSMLLRTHVLAPSVQPHPTAAQPWAVIERPLRPHHPRSPGRARGHGRRCVFSPFPQQVQVLWPQRPRRCRRVSAQRRLLPRVWQSAQPCATRARARDEQVTISVNSAEHSLKRFRHVRKARAAAGTHRLVAFPSAGTSRSLAGRAVENNEVSR